MEENLEHVLTEWSMEPSIWLGIALLVGVYLLATGPWRSRVKGSEPVPRARRVSFVAGAFVMLIALASPLDHISDHYLFSAHMVQHLLLTLVAPPLMLIGTPGWMLRPFLRFKLVASIARLLTRPIVAFALFNIVFSVWHAPALYQSALESEPIHIFEHLLFISTAFLNWWAILSPLAELPRLPYPGQILYLFLDAVPSTVLGAILVFASDVLYPTYASAPRIFGISALEDQIYSGLIMAMPGGMAYLLALSIVFFRWMGQEDSTERRNAVAG
ncbi:MAG: cytochrome c oxidase assembly protein [Chloroflexi bacterium]|nr:cytochrome c oxidase assembly protein [Chloroflexota bacterium]